MARRTISLFRHPVTKQLLPLSEIKKTMTKKEFRAFKKKEGLDFWTQLYRIFIGDGKDSGYDSMYDDPRL